MLPGYVRGARSRVMRPVLQPANLVHAEWRARTGEQLAALTVELIESRAALHAEPLPAAALEWLTALTTATLPEGQPYPALYSTLSAVIAAIAAAPGARDWAAALVRYELMLLAELGFGLDLGSCVVTGAVDDLCWVSPRSGAAVSAEAGAGYAERLLPLPAFIREGGGANLDDVLAGLRLSGHFLARDLLTGRASGVLAARDRLIDRLARAAG